MNESVPPPSVRAGMLVGGKYRIESLLGEGGMGTVWAAMHVDLGQKVALKLISSEFARSKDLLARFRSEAKAAAALQSRYVVRMYDSGVTDDGRPFIAMEYLNGESLEDRLNRLGRLSLHDTVRVVAQVGKALKRAHEQGIIHRDLKPANIFLATTGDEEEVAKVLDFGIAKVLHHEGDHGQTATGIILGTPLYMSPEQARALKTLDHRSDLYSLGMVTYRMLIGEPPFRGESFGDLVYAICTQPLPSMHQQVPSLPQAMDTWFQSACAKDPEQRYATASQLVEALIAASGITGSQFGQVDTGGRAMPASLMNLAAPSSSHNSSHAATQTGGGATVEARSGEHLGVHTGGGVQLGTGNPPGAGGTSGPNTTGTAVAVGTLSSKQGRSKWPLWAVGVLGVAGIAAAGVFVVSKSLREPDSSETPETEAKTEEGAAAGTAPEQLDERNGETHGEKKKSLEVTPPPTITVEAVEPTAAPSASAEAVPEDEADPNAGASKPVPKKRPPRAPPKAPAKPVEEQPKSPSKGNSGTPDMGF